MSGVSLLRQIMADCSDAERKVAAYILSNPREAVFCTVAQLARRADTSAPAVVRLCQRAGLSGYREFQILLAQDLYAPPTQEPSQALFHVDAGQGVEALAADRVNAAKAMLDRVLDLLEPATFESAARALASARAVVAIGPAEAKFAAYRLAQGLQGLGIPCSYSFETAEQAEAARALTHLDMIVAFAGSRLPEALSQAARYAQRAGARILAVAPLGADALCDAADFRLAVPTSEPSLADPAALRREALLLMADLMLATLVAGRPERPRSSPKRETTGPLGSRASVA